MNFKKYAIFLSMLATGFTYSQTLCASEEESVFDCEIGKKILSVCASKELDDSKGWLQYRFGTAEKIDLSYPETKVHPKKYFQFNRAYSAAENVMVGELRFKNGATQYTVYREDAKGKSEAGVYVTIREKDTYLKCKNTKKTQSFTFKMNELGLDEFP
jgi:hypothetical protein